MRRQRCYCRTEEGSVIDCIHTVCNNCFCSIVSVATVAFAAQNIGKYFRTENKKEISWIRLRLMDAGLRDGNCGIGTECESIVLRSQLIPHEKSQRVK